MVAHCGTIMAGRWATSWRVISQEMPPWPITIAARSTVTGTGPAASSRFHLAPGPQVRGQLLVLAAETTEVDDPFQPRVGGRGGEGPRRLGVLALEVVVVQRVHEVVRHVHPIQGRGQAVRIGDVARRPARQRPE